MIALDIQNDANTFALLADALAPKPAAALLNGTPWLATVECDADLEAVESWINQGIEAGVLSPGRIEFTGDDVIVDVACGLINFTARRGGDAA